jgi:hypothetical protein
MKSLSEWRESKGINEIAAIADKTPTDPTPTGKQINWDLWYKVFGPQGNVEPELLNLASRMVDVVQSKDPYNEPNMTEEMIIDLVNAIVYAAKKQEAKESGKRFGLGKSWSGSRLASLFDR